MEIAHGPRSRPQERSSLPSSHNRSGCSGDGLRRRTSYSRGLFTASRRSGERNYLCAQLGYATQEDDFIAPYVVNGAFALELHLKLLGFLESRTWSKKHALDELFDALSAESRAAIDAAVGESLSGSPFLRDALAILKAKGVLIDWNTRSLLKRSADAYVNWRYAFESTPGCFAGYSEIQNALEREISKRS
jgi:hypothetical protein